MIEENEDDLLENNQHQEADEFDLNDQEESTKTPEQAARDERVFEEELLPQIVQMMAKEKKWSSQKVKEITE